MLSGLTIRGRCLLAAGAAAGLCGLVLDERDLIRVAAFTVALPLLALLLCTRTQFGLTARREIAPPRIPVGSEARVLLHLQGHGALPLGGILLEDGVPPALGNRPRFVLDQFPGNRGATVQYTVAPELRGIHQVGPLRTRISDPFALAEFERELAGRARVVAVPRIVPLGKLPAGSGLGIGEDGSARLRAGHGDDDIMVRQYRHGDDMRRVHWKSTARRDELMVRVEERPWHGGITVLLDRRSAAHRGNGMRSSVEWAISAAASVCVHLHHHGQHVRLTTTDGLVLSGGRGPADGGGRSDAAVLDGLAAIQPSSQRDLRCTSDPGDGRELLAILGATTVVGVEQLTKSRAPGMRSHAILLDVAAWNGHGRDGGIDVHETASLLRAAGWNVGIASGPSTSVAAVWAELCQDSAARHGAGATG